MDAEIPRLSRRKRLALFLKRHERHGTTLAFIAGFIWDNLTLTRVDLWYDNIVLSSYLIIAGTGIILYNTQRSKKQETAFAQKTFYLLPLLIQFAFGGLFSGYIVFYSRSGSFAASWPFLLFLIALMFGNELLRERYARLTFQLGVFFIAALSYATFLLPVLVGRIGAGMFLLSGLLSIAIVSFVIFILSKVARERIEEIKRVLFPGLAIIYMLFNSLYFANLIPPLPLSLKEIGVYHKIVRTGNEYELVFEPPPWYSPFKKTAGTMRWTPGSPIYVYSSVFAPTRLTTDILHIWSRFDEERTRWRETNVIEFPLSGGRDSGYRGYSVKESATPGTWRVDVTTERGQIIGRIIFDVVEATTPPKLRTETR